MQRQVKYSLLASVFLAIATYLFWGPLFPWSPLKPGYQKVESPIVSIYFHQLTDKDTVILQIGQIIEEVEKIHQLSFKKHFRVVVLDEESNMKRYLPWMKGSGYSVSLSIANLIYIGPAARKYPDGIEAYLKHEMSHMLLDQNTSFANARKIRAQGWFSEGMAEYAGDHQFYNEAAFLRLYRSGQMDFCKDFEKDPMKMTPGELKLRYTYYKLFIRFLVNRYGLPNLQEFLKSYLENPESYKRDLVNLYGQDLEELLIQFEATFIEAPDQ